MDAWGVVFLQFFICFALYRAIINLNERRKRHKTKKTMIVLGSGGHTTEMFQFLSTLTGFLFPFFVI
jgi:hypothetical protein